MSTYSVSDLLNKTLDCGCGRTHSSKVEQVIIRENAMDCLPEQMAHYGYKKAYIICDVNTWDAAAKQVNDILRAAGCSTIVCKLQDKELVPDEKALGYVTMQYDPSCDVIIGVGTGVLNDTSKFFSHRMKMPYFIVATAPSMDGFASTGAALISENLKTTYNAHVPQAIIGPVEVLAAAPMDMISAGLADILGKFTCLIDWNLAREINGEYYCVYIEELVRSSLKKVMDNAPKAAQRDHTAIANIMEALVVTGIAMEYAGNSRPASGAEHHLSHYWEMQYQAQGRKAVLHGTKVGIGTVAVTWLYNKLKDTSVDFAAVRQNASFDFDGWKEKMTVAYGVSAPGVIALEEKVGKNAIEGRLQRLTAAENKWESLQKMMGEMIPSVETMEQTLSRLDGPIRPAQVGIDRDMFFDSVCYAKEVRDRFTVLQLLWDLGLMEQFARELTEYMFG